MLFGAYRILSIGASYDKVAESCLKTRPGNTIICKEISIGFGLLVVFILFQIADGIMTYYGVVHTRMGINYEANPVIVFYMQLIGVVAALIIAKFLSIILGTVLYWSQDRFSFFTLLALTSCTFIFVILHALMLIKLTGIFN